MPHCALTVDIPYALLGGFVFHAATLTETVEHRVCCTKNIGVGAAVCFLTGNQQQLLRGPFRVPVLIVGTVIGQCQKIQRLALCLANLVTDRDIAWQGIIAGLPPYGTVGRVIGMDMRIGSQPQALRAGSDALGSGPGCQSVVK